MATMIPAADFAVIEEGAARLLGVAREKSVGHGALAADTPAETVVLHEEVRALQLAVVALSKQSALDEEAGFIALGDAIGSLLAQSLGDHVVLYKAFKDQCASTYDQIREMSRPKGNA